VFSSRIQPGQQANRLSQAVDRLRRAGRPILNLAQSNPTACGLQPDGLLASLQDPAIGRYEADCRGAWRSRLALAGRLGCDPERLFLTASTSEAYSWLFKLLCDPGDAVLVPKPGYPLFDYLAGLENVEARPYRLEYRHPQGWQIDTDQLTAAAAQPRVKAIVLIHPNNPTGSFVSQAERDFILYLASRHGLAIIADEVFLAYPLETREAPLSFATAESGLVFSLNGLSKLLCLPQLKLGWIQLAGDPAVVAEALPRLELIADTYLSVGAAPMHALPQLLPQVEAFTSGLRQRLQANLATVRRIFDQAGSPFRLLRCEGGWTALLEVPRYLPEEELALALLEQAGLLVHPGYFFDCERDGLLALSLIVPPDEFAAGCQRLRAWFDDHGRE